ncbi:hypothetical protein [Terrisporobacter hibernicus]|uniref:hypothetical protein n=1 Tax=Terrisporobacter hibernicus TaxID=2813371 RepID=UPI0038CD8D30
MLTISSSVYFIINFNFLLYVRIINFYYNIEQKGIIYFSTFSDNLKVDEFEKNNIVSFTTIPYNSTEHIRCSGAVIQKSNLITIKAKS